MFDMIIFPIRADYKLSDKLIEALCKGNSIICASCLMLINTSLIKKRC